MGSSDNEYQSVWSNLIVLVDAKNREKAIELADSDAALQAQIELQLTDSFAAKCHGVLAALRLVPYYSVMGKEIKTIWYEKRIWGEFCKFVSSRSLALTEIGMG